MKCVAWNKGRLVSDIVLNNIIELAKQGHMTKEASELVLVPDRRYGRPDEDGMRPMKSVQKHECRTLGQVFGRYAKAA